MKRSLLFAGLIALLVGCQAEDIPAIRLSDAALTFKGAENSPVVIKVYTSAPEPWEATAEASWVSITDVTSTSFAICVKDNESEEARVADVCIRAGKAENRVSVRQMGKDHTFARYRSYPNCEAVVMSPSGKYVGMYDYDWDENDNTVQYAIIIDVATDKKTVLGPYPRELYTFISVCCISDEGDLIIATENKGNYRFTLNEEIMEIVPPAGFTKRPEISQVAVDGTMVGWSGKGGVSYPFKWVNGEAIELPKPELNYRNGPIGDVQARGISADGRIIYGTTWDNFDFGMIYWDENGDVHYVGEDVRYCRTVDRPKGDGTSVKYNLCDGLWCTSTNTCVSPNGKYIAGTFRRESMDEQGGIGEVNCPAFFNTETQKTVLFEELFDGCGVSATSDGLGFATNSSLGPTGGYVVDIEQGIVLGNTLDWIYANYGIRLQAGYILYMPDTKDRFLGAMMMTDGPALMGVNWYVGPER